MSVKESSARVKLNLQVAFVNKNLSHRFHRWIQVKRAKLYLVKLPNRISSLSCISGTACLITCICEISLFVTVAKRGKDFAHNLGEFGVACSGELEVNQWIALDIQRLSGKSERAKNTIHCFSIQLFRERLSDKVHATTLKGIVGGFEFTVFQRNLKEWHERPWTYVCEC